MYDYYRLLRPLLFALPAEAAHHVAATALRNGWVPSAPPVVDSRLGIAVCGMGFDSPIGLAAGFDKNAELFQACYAQGFGFAEVGTITPEPQYGNDKPRMFRLKEDQAVINRMGFNNDGYDVAFARVFEQSDDRGGILGVNIGKNKDQEDALADYLLLMREAYPYTDYITVNISSPNTKGLRDLQKGEHFEALIKAVMQERNGLAAYFGYRRPIWVKIAPDLEQDALHDMLEVMMTYRVDAVIISNTTIARPDHLQHKAKAEAGGLSGAPLTEMSLAMMRDAYAYTKGALPLIGSGGMMSAADAVARIRAGASLVQLYSGLVYRGMDLVHEIKYALLEELEHEGLDSVAALVGIDHSITKE